MGLSSMPNNVNPVLTGSGWRRSRTLFWIAVAIVSAAAGYLVHHSSYFSEHRLEEAILAIVLSSLCGVVLVGTIANRRHPEPPDVILARGAIDVEPADPDVVDTLASIHARYLSSGLFVSLGPAFMRAYYSGFIRSPYAVAFVAKAKGHTVGMLVGTTNQRRHRRWVLTNQSALLGAVAVVAMATRPVTTVRFLRTRLSRYRQALKRRREPASESDETSVAVLTHVAVVLGARGEGAGAKLVKRFESSVRREGTVRAYLVTNQGGAGAREFYSGLGWHVTGTAESLDGERTVAMGKDLA